MRKRTRLSLMRVRQVVTAAMPKLLKATVHEVMRALWSDAKALQPKLAKCGVCGKWAERGRLKKGGWVGECCVSGDTAPRVAA